MFKKTALLFVTVLLLSVAVMASEAQYSFGANILSTDNKRIEQGISISFSMIAMDPYSEGEDAMAGFFESTMGMYPFVPRGTIVEMTVAISGLKKIQNVAVCLGEKDPGADDGILWHLCESTSSPDTYRYVLDTRMMPLGPKRIAFRVNHRDNKDKYTFLIFTMSWSRAGVITQNLHLVVQKPPVGFSDLRGEEILPYLRGFVPVTATNGQAQSTQQVITVPPQKAEQTVIAPTTQKVEEPKDLPMVEDETPTQEDESSSEPVRSGMQLGVWQLSYVPDRDELDPFMNKARNELKRAGSGVSLSRSKSYTVAVLQCSESFKVTYITPDGRRVSPKVKRASDGTYEAKFAGLTKYFAGGYLVAESRFGTQKIKFGGVR